jgi:hypothetical protein
MTNYLPSRQSDNKEPSKDPNIPEWFYTPKESEDIYEQKVMLETIHKRTKGLF